MSCRWLPENVDIHVNIPETFQLCGSLWQLNGEPWLSSVLAGDFDNNVSLTGRHRSKRLPDCATTQETWRAACSQWLTWCACGVKTSVFEKSGRSTLLHHMHADVGTSVLLSRGCCHCLELGPPNLLRKPGEGQVVKLLSLLLKASALGTIIFFVGRAWKCAGKVFWTRWSTCRSEKIISWLLAFSIRNTRTSCSVDRRAFTEDSPCRAKTGCRCYFTIAGEPCRRTMSDESVRVALR